MTIDRIRELLREADTAEPGYIDATWDSELERALELAADYLYSWSHCCADAESAIAACRRVVELADREQQKKEGK